MRRLAMPLAVALGVHFYLVSVRGYHWQLATLVALAVAALTWSTRSSMQRRWWVGRRWEIAATQDTAATRDTASDTPSTEDRSPSGDTLE